MEKQIFKNRIWGDFANNHHFINWLFFMLLKWRAAQIEVAKMAVAQMACCSDDCC